MFICMSYHFDISFTCWGPGHYHVNIIRRSYEICVNIMCCLQSHMILVCFCIVEWYDCSMIFSMILVVDIHGLRAMSIPQWLKIILDPRSWSQNPASRTGSSDARIVVSSLGAHSCDPNWDNYRKDTEVMGDKYSKCIEVYENAVHIMKIIWNRREHNVFFAILHFVCMFLHCCNMFVTLSGSDLGPGPRT